MKAGEVKVGQFHNAPNLLAWRYNLRSTVASACETPGDHSQHSGIKEQAKPQSQGQICCPKNKMESVIWVPLSVPENGQVIV